MSRFLVVEDDPASLDLIVYLLEAGGHVARAAPTAERAFACLEDETFDLVICDLHLPDATGAEIAARIRADGRWRDLPIVAVSAEFRTDSDAAIPGGWFDSTLAKPIDPRSFEAHLMGCLARAQARRTG